MSNWDAGATLLLGAFHGLNPAMGWLFALAIGFQARSRRAVVGAFGPIAIGHLASMAFTVLVVEELRVLSSDTTIRIAGALALAAFASWRFASSHRHPRWVGMCLRRRELALWSFLMSTAHGAGIMVAPVLIGLQGTIDRSGAQAHDQADLGLLSASLGVGAVGIALHVAAMLAVMGVVAIVVYERLGLKVLRTAWLNTDRLWAAAFVLAAFITLLS